MLAAQQCEACRADSPRVSEDEMRALLQEIPEWIIDTDHGIPRLARVFHFKNFIDALAFTNRVGELAEREGHHPLITTEWGRVTVQWWTHAIHGLHKNDFICAAKTDQLLHS